MHTLLGKHFCKKKKNPGMIKIHEVMQTKKSDIVKY